MLWLQHHEYHGHHHHGDEHLVQHPRAYLVLVAVAYEMDYPCERQYGNKGHGKTFIAV